MGEHVVVEGELVSVLLLYGNPVGVREGVVAWVLLVANMGLKSVDGSILNLVLQVGIVLEIGLLFLKWRSYLFVALNEISLLFFEYLHLCLHVINLVVFLPNLFFNLIQLILNLLNIHIGLI